MNCPLLPTMYKECYHHRTSSLFSEWTLKFCCADFKSCPVYLEWKGKSLRFKDEVSSELIDNINIRLNVKK